MGAHRARDRDRPRSADRAPRRRHLRLAALAADQRRRFEDGESATDLVHERARAVDALCVETFERIVLRVAADPALVAVGGYGRGELHPHSDVDILILVPDDAGDDLLGAVERCIAALWDAGLRVGHAVRTVAETAAAAAADITIATNLMESRWLAGDERLFDAMCDATSAERIWPPREFFVAKFAEQQARHAQYHDTAYKLEPNVKESPGGLRDLQMIEWVAKRQRIDLRDLLTRAEYAQLVAARDWLWRVRFALHLVTGRCEDRLLFDHQLKLAQLFGYKDAGHSLGVELFMQDHYRALIELSRLNEVLLQLFDELLTSPDDDAAPEPVNERFEVVHGYLQVRHPRVFRDTPSALLEIFHVLQQRPELAGVRAATVRLLLQSRELVDDAFRADPVNRELFMAILRQPAGITHELRRMNRYGILGRYIPAFGRIVGRMQYDLFHAYTVDEHTLFVVANLRRFALERFHDEYPFANDVFAGLPKPEIAYIAGLFHDIAKGRGGDHSELGAEEAERFCTDHGLSRYETGLVVWLVRNHLLLSVTAQKRDISDPQVIHEFATLVGDENHLDHLFVLTCADVRGTNPELWNSWKRMLFEDLYRQTRRALRRGLANPIDKNVLVAETRLTAAALCEQYQVDEARLNRLWARFGDDYFLQHTPDEIAWHASVLVGELNRERPVVMLRQASERGGTAVFVHAYQDASAFARATASLDRLRLTVMDARLARDRDGRSLATYIVLEDDGSPITGRRRIDEIQRSVLDAMQRDGAPRPVTRRAPRRVRAFHTPVQVVTFDDSHNRRTVVELVAGDRPGLLAEVGKVFAACGARVVTAKITTVGERVEDVFFITEDEEPLTPEARDRVEAALTAALTP